MAEQMARRVLAVDKRHLFEAEMTETRRTHGLAHHEALAMEGLGS
ncbi:MAG: hypothetical protein ABI563_11490 [Specibacter sp.]